ncbi:FAD-binding oxidoreductase [Ruegeria sp. SCSIO 43209]|uniref:NAD(P)/FAD-dependent oxidoreductase n=1 Tax=Ruegeria sp. SCSIO 43209 TaxID=2793010 RepID=UPI001CA9BA9C|nr:FAD-binding oxidoreductase [Ruegeria sp. SCSIO 43209]UAB88464.1 FAD-binding oxidoreductase [Ruegeria sp. SCSIO 43209]
MRRIFPDYAYGPAPRAGCWWDETIATPAWPKLEDDISVDVAVIGGGFTGLSAALHLSEAGVSVAVFEAETPGWGASGRNGGFCCLGGSKLSKAGLTRRYGQMATQAYYQAEEDAVSLVADLLRDNQIDAETHSKGETQLAHSRRAMERLRRSADPAGQLHEIGELRSLGLGGAFFGGYTTPIGFALNPRKYLFGLAGAAQAKGATLFQNSPITQIKQATSGFVLTSPAGHVRASNVLVCTNGYSSEDLPPWLAARYMPAQSTVLVTRPLTDVELQAQGWTSDQMAYDTRNLLHYFRLMPNRRFLFGTRGGLLSSPGAEARIRQKAFGDFRRMFPAWDTIDVTHKWSGMVCLARNLVPFVGPVPEHPGMYAGFAYHGNGVAMGTYCGRALARLVLGQSADIPSPIAGAPGRFPFGRWRRAVMPPAYAYLGLADL